MARAFMDIAPDGTSALSREGSTIRILSLNNGQEVAEFKPFGQSDYAISRARYSRDGSEIAIVGSGIAIYDSSDGERKRTCQLADGNSAIAVAWSPDGKKLAVVTRSPYLLEVYDAQTGKLEKQFDGPITTDRSLHWSEVIPRDIRFKGDTTLVYATKQGRVGYIDVESGEQLRSRQIGRNSNQAVLTPDGTQLLQVTGDRIELRNLDDGQLQATILPQLNEQNDWAVISADGHVVASPKAHKHLQHVIQTKKGSRILPPFRFSSEFHWKNDPTKVRLTK